jgi:hypothetical protein
LLVLDSADHGSSAWYIGDPGTHDPTMDAPCEAPAACRDSRIENAHVVPTLHIIYLHVHYNVNTTSSTSNLSMLPRWLPEAPLVFAKASECTKLLDLLPPTAPYMYVCDAGIIRPESGFLKPILQNDFVCFKFLLGTRIVDLVLMVGFEYSTVDQLCARA